MTDSINAPITGVWRVIFEGAPTPWHMYTFTSDGIVIQSNPARGNSRTSDTNLHGIWRHIEHRDKVQVRLEEWRMNLEDPTDVTLGIVTFEIKITGDTLSGLSKFEVRDRDSGAIVEGPYDESLTGQRVRFAN